jgi:predicted RND superfamily exporter protein
MARLARHALAHPRLWLLFIGIVTLLLGAGLLRLELRTDGAALHPVGHPDIEAAEHDRWRFLDPRQVVLLVHAPPGAQTLASPTGFRFLAALHAALRSQSAIRSGGVVSIAGLLRVSPESAGLSLGTYLDSIPDDPAEFAVLVEEARAVARTDGLLLSPDGRLAAFYVPLAEDRRVASMVGELQAWLDFYASAPYELWLTGPEVAEAMLGDKVLKDLALFVPAMVVVIALLLALTLRSPGGVLIPLAEALVVLVWVLGSMGWLGIPITLVTTILPVVLMAIAITDELHILERVQAAAVSTPLAEAVEAALSEVGRPIIATSLTTALGFLAFLGATVVPMRHFGVWTAIGILLALLLSFCFIPALIVSLPRSWFVPRSAAGGRSLGALRRRAVARPGAALVMGLLLMAVCVPGVLRLRVEDAWMDNFAPDAPLVAAERAFNDSFWGSYRFDVVVEAEPDFFYGPAGVRLTEAIRDVASGAPHVGGVTTYLEPLDEIARALGVEGELGSLSALQLADLAMVAEMGENRVRLRQLITDRGEATRLRLFANRASYERARRLRDYLDERLPALAEDDDVAFHYSGDLPVAIAVVDSIVGNQLRSIGLALASVFIMLIAFFSGGEGVLAGIRRAWVAMVPVLATLVMVFGAMGYAGIPLGIATSMFAALSVGIGVDFGVHFLHRFQRARTRGLDPSSATVDAFGSTGTVLGWNAFVLAIGFMVLTLSSMKPNHDLGLLLSAAILACYVSAVLLLPRLLPLTAAAVFLLAIPLAVLSPASASAGGCTTATNDADASDSQAVALMSALETGFRRGARVVRMDIQTTYGQRPGSYHRTTVLPPSQKTLWGVFNGDAENTRLLYVFSGPGRLAGTTLLMHDRAGSLDRDAMWLYLRSFDIFKRLEPKSQQVMVPGTALTYEDSRGFIPQDKYYFSSIAGGLSITQAETVAQSPAAAGSPTSVQILACPRNASIRENLGYASLLLTVDRERELVLGVQYTDLGGKPLKTYRLLQEVEVDGRFYPGEVLLENKSEGYITRIGYEYWKPEVPPMAALFEPDLAKGRFIDRLKTYVAQMGQGERILAELERADEIVREFEAKLKRIQESEHQGRRDQE